MRSILVRYCCSLIFFYIWVAPVCAHDGRPLSITIVEQTEGLYRVIVRAPPSLSVANAPLIQWPQICSVEQASPLSEALGSVSLIQCREGLTGETVEISYPSFNPSISTLFRFESNSGTSVTAVLSPEQTYWQVPVEPHWTDVALQYVILGIEHILKGVDHLLFVIGLLLLAKTPRKIFYAVSGFTVAHSITLSAAALNWVRVPVELVEAMIAMSIFFLAVEVCRSSDSFSKRYPVGLAFVFGLLHGFGFASALGEIHLPTKDVVIGLLFFNAGVELGQLAFIAVLAIAFSLWTKFLGKNRFSLEADKQQDAVWHPALIKIGAYAIGVPSAYWVFERGFGFIV